MLAYFCQHFLQVYIFFTKPEDFEWYVFAKSHFPIIYTVKSVLLLLLITTLFTFWGPHLRIMFFIIPPGSTCDGQ